MPSVEADSTIAVKTSTAAGDAGPRGLIGADRLSAIARCWIVVALAYYAFDLSGQTRDGWTNGDGRPLGDDFVNYWSGAFLAWHGRVIEIFDWNAFHAFQQSFTGPSLQFYHYGYPPVLLVLTAPFAFIPYLPALGVWLVSSWYAFYRALRLAAPETALLLSLATPALFINAIGGQNGAWTAALIGGGLVLIDRRPVVAGILFGLLIYKPHLGVLLPVALIAGQRWRALGAAAATAIALVAVSLVLFGADLWLAYSENLATLKRVILEDGAGVWHRMLSVFVFGRRLGLDVGSAYALQIAFGAIAVFVVARSWWKNDPPAIRNALVILGTCLATPYLQDYDLVMGAFVVVWLGSARAQALVSPRSAQVAMAAILLLPLVAATIAKTTGFSIGPLLIAPVFALFARISLRQERGFARA